MYGGRWARRPSGLATPSCAVPRRRAASRAAASSSPRASSRKASASAPRGRGRRCSVVNSHDAVWWCVCFVVWHVQHACSILRCFAQRVTYSICERRKRLSNPRGEPFIRQQSLDRFCKNGDRTISPRQPRASTSIRQFASTERQILADAKKGLVVARPLLRSDASGK